MGKGDCASGIGLYSYIVRKLKQEAPMFRASLGNLIIYSVSK